MSELDDLWRALREAPYDRGVHTVLADALIERGDPHGELMAVQLDIETARRHDLLALRRREHELLAQLRDRLLGGLPPGSYKICRGVVAAARIGAELEHQRELFAERTLLEELFLALNVDPVIVRDHPAARCIRIFSLGFPRQIGSTPLHLPMLDEMRIHAAPAGACALVAANPTVGKVIFDRIRFNDGRELVAILPQLTSLRLRTWVPPPVFRLLVDAPLDHLEHLRIPAHELGSLLPSLFARDLPRLRELDARGVDLPGATRIADPMTDDHVRTLAGSTWRPTKLALGVTSVTTRSLAILAASPLAAEVESLVLEKIPLTETDIAALATLPRLRDVQLLDCSLDDAAARAVGDWERIDLTGNPAISDAAKHALEERFGGDVTFAPVDEWIEHEI